MTPELPAAVQSLIDDYANAVSDWENGHKGTADVAAAEAALRAAILDAMESFAASRVRGVREALEFYAHPLPILAFTPYDPAKVVGHYSPDDGAKARAALSRGPS